MHFVLRLLVQRLRVLFEEVDLVGVAVNDRSRNYILDAMDVWVQV